MRLDSLRHGFPLPGSSLGSVFFCVGLDLGPCLRMRVCFREAFDMGTVCCGIFWVCGPFPVRTIQYEDHVEGRLFAMGPWAAGTVRCGSHLLGGAWTVGTIRNRDHSVWGLFAIGPTQNGDHLQRGPFSIGSIWYEDYSQWGPFSTEIVCNGDHYGFSL